MTKRAIGRILGALILTLAGMPSLAGPVAAEPKLTGDPDQAKSDTVLLQDETKATAEFQRRIRDQIKYRNGLLIIQDRAASGVSVAPATIMWMVDCGDGGLTVTFGTGSGDPPSAKRCWRSPRGTRRAVPTPAIRTGRGP
jgi:hypothetical protein